MKAFKSVLIIAFLVLLVVAFVAAVVGAVTGEVFGLFDFEVIEGFFVGIGGEELITGVIVAAITLVPQLGMNFLNWLKNKFGLEDEPAHDFIFVVLFLFSGVGLLVTGTLDIAGMAFTLENLITTGLSIYGLSQLAYNRLWGNKV